MTKKANRCTNTPSMVNSKHSTSLVFLMHSNQVLQSIVNGYAYVFCFCMVPEPCQPRVALLCFLTVAMTGTFIIEQPRSSLLILHQRMQQLLDHFKVGGQNMNPNKSNHIMYSVV